MTPFRRTAIRVSAALGLVATVAATTSAAETLPAQPPPASRPVALVAAPDTTLITAPLLPDGTPDYIAALNAELSAGVTADHNAALPILRAMGPASISAEFRPLLLNALKLDLPADGPYFVNLYTFAQAHGGIDAAVDKADDATRKALWTARDFPLVADWLKANKAPLAQIAAASRLPRFYCPLVSPAHPPSLLEASLVGLASPLRAACNAFAARALLRAASGDPAAARDDLLTLHRLARLELQAPFVFGPLVAAAIDNLAFHAEQAILAAGKLTPAEARTLLADLQALPEITLTSPSRQRAERFVQLGWLLPAVRGNTDETLRPYVTWAGMDMVPAPLTPATTLDQADWNITFRAVNQRQDAIDAALAKPLATARHAALQVFIQQDQANNVPPSVFGALSQAPDTAPAESDQARAHRLLLAMGEFLSRRPGETIPAFSSRIALFFTRIQYFTGRAAILIDRVIAQHRLTLLAAALAVYHADHNAYPPTLEPLHAPAYLPALPLDPFSAKSFVYRTTPAGGYLLYSVGDNGLDDNAQDQSQKGDDIVIRMP